MDKIIQKIKDKLNLVIFIPTVLCFLQWITGLVSAASDGQIDSAEFNKLLASANGIEAFILVVVMLALRFKPK